MPDEEFKIDGDTAVEAVQSFLPRFPLLESSVLFEFGILYDSGFVIYGVKVTNNSDSPMGRLRIRPRFPEGRFVPDEESKVVGPFGPREERIAAFRLRPVGELGDVCVSGTALQGRDVSIRMVLKVFHGNADFEIFVKNNKTFSLTGVRVHPVLPEDFVPMEGEKTLDAILPGETRSLKFQVITREEWERREKHARGLERPWMYPPEKPRRKRRAHPRAYTAGELAAIEKRLLAMASVEEILERIGDTPDEEEPWEDVPLVWTEESIEEEGHEYPMEIWTEEGVEIDEPLEEPFEWQAAIFVKEEVVEEEGLEEDIRIKLPMEKVCEEGPIEEEFVFEAPKQVKVLGLKGTRAEDIETEPMEMDL